MDFQGYKKIVDAILSGDMREFQRMFDIWQVLRNMKHDLPVFEDPAIKNYAVNLSRHVHKICSREAIAQNSKDVAEVYWRLLIFEAQMRQVDSYLLALERHREMEKRFYAPRRSHFIRFGIIQALQDVVDDKLDLLTISMPPGTGKLLADNTPILTDNGWKNHGDLEVGDRVLSPNGNFVSVQHVFPKDIANVKVTFTNGEEIICHENHEWLVYNKKRGSEHIIETKDLLKYKLDYGVPGKRGHRYLYLIPKREYVVGEEKDLPVPPYTLGAWLGDGTNRKPLLTVCDTDTAIIEHVKADGFDVTAIHKQAGCTCYSFSDLRKKLKSIGMCYRDESMPKRIPGAYMTASIEQRLQLLAGLLDTDGTVDKNKCRYLFSTTDECLRDDFVSLVSTFGWRTSVTEEAPKVSTSGIVGKKAVYVIGFNPDIQIPCVVERKRLSAFKSSNRIAIKSVERVEPCQGNCIQVEGGLYLSGRTCITTHNSTLGIYFLTGCMGWWPEMPNLASAHSGILTRSFYDGVTQILNDKFEYAWHEIFPTVEYDPKSGTNSKEQTVNVGMPKRFKSLTCRAINASLTGATRCEKMLYVDDLCSGIEEAMSRDRMDKLWTSYNTDLKTRQKDQCKELHIQTRWSVGDVVGRLKELYGKDPRARFISVPALDKYGNSNFEYKFGVGFTKEYFDDMRDSMDDVSFRCLYMNEPIEREGLLYHPEELRRYVTLPKGKPDAVLSIADTKNSGIDYYVQPVFLKYGDDYYMVDTICSDNSDYEAQYMRSVSLIMANNVEACRFESNAGGTRIAFEVNKRLQESEYYCNITENYTVKNKETKIIVYAPWVKQHVIFKDQSLYSKKDDYGMFLEQVLSYTMAAKVKHDDAPDVLAMFAEWQSRPGRGETVIMGSLF